MQYKLTWREANGSPLKHKIYQDSTMLAKARTWLSKNGAVDIDVAVIVSSQDTEKES